MGNEHQIKSENLSFNKILVVFHREQLHCEPRNLTEFLDKQPHTTHTMRLTALYTFYQPWFLLAIKVWYPTGKLDILLTYFRLFVFIYKIFCIVFRFSILFVKKSHIMII